MQPEELNHHHQQIQSAAVVAAAGDDFLDQMLSALPSAWTDLGNPKSPWDLAPTNPRSAIGAANDRNLYSDVLAGNSPDDDSAAAGDYAQYDDPSPLAFRMRSLDDVDASFKALNSAGVEGLYSGFGGPLQRGGNQTTVQNHFQNAQAPPPLTAAVGAGGGCGAPPRQRVRARRGQATDPHSIAERLRREKIAERMKGLQELVPNANKTDKASMLDEIIDYVKFLQLQVKVLSMSRLGGAATVAPLMADVSSEAGRGGGNTATTGSDRLAVSENQVAKLMEEDMGSAMQYLQGKGLCLMPISLASAISTAAGLIPPSLAAGGAPSSPSMSALTVQSAAVADAVKDAASVSKP